MRIVLSGSIRGLTPRGSPGCGWAQTSEGETLKRVMEFPQSLVRAGVARRDITPPVGIYHRMWGAATHDQSTGVHRPLTATALAVAPREEDGAACTPIVMLSVDHCLLWNTEMRALLNAASTSGAADQDNVILFFTHTHAAGLMGLERRELPGGDLIPDYLTRLGTTIAALVAESVDSLQPAVMQYAAGRCDLAANRDFFDEETDQYVCGLNPEGPSDDTVLVVRVSAGEQGTLATLVNYACHPTTLAWDNTLISPDYVGALREVVESSEGAPCFFMQGASGDIGPREGYVGDTAVADRNGRQLGYAALAALEGLPPPETRYRYAGPVISGATIGTWEYEPIGAEQRQRAAAWIAHRSIVPLRYRDDLGDADALQADRTRWEKQEIEAVSAGEGERAREARAMLERITRKLTRIGSLPTGDSYPYPLRAWRMGEAVWLAYDGEHYNVLQRALRERFPGTPIVLGTLANGSHVWYLPDAESYGKGLYQESASVLAKGSLETLIEASSAAIEELVG